MNIRAAKKSDLNRCEELLSIPELELAGGGYLTAAEYSTYLDKNFFLVAEDDNKKVQGCLVAEPLKMGVVMLWFLGVNKIERGKGIGKLLMKQFEKNCKNNKKSWVVLYAPAKVKNTIEFYKKNKYNQGKLHYEFNKKL